MKYEYVCVQSIVMKKSIDMGWTSKEWLMCYVCGEFRNSRIQVEVSVTAQKFEYFYL